MQDRIDTLIQYANGRMRSRTITRDDVRTAVLDAIKDDYGWRTGGMITVKAYKYQAYTAACAAIRISRDIYLSATCINAKGSPVTWWGPDSTREASCLAFLQHMRNWPLSEYDTKFLNTWVKLTPKEIKALKKG